VLSRRKEPGFELGRWEEATFREPRRVTRRCFCFTSATEAFVRAVYENGWLLWGFDWIKWGESPEATALREDPEAMRRASPEQLTRLLTLYVREDSVWDGALLAAFESGLLIRILERAASLASEHQVEMGTS